MLVLTRKTDEQILIGDDIKITIVRVRGNSVRIGIDAPRQVRVVRGELDAIDSNNNEAAEFELSDRDQVFAHPQAKIISGRFKVPGTRHPKAPSGKNHPIAQSSLSTTVIGCGRRGGDEGKRSGAPLSGFISAK